MYAYTYTYTCYGTLQKDSIRYRDVRYKDQPLPPNSKQIITSSINVSSTTPSSGSLSSQITSSTQPSKSLSAQNTITAQPTLSSQSALSSQSTLSSQPDLLSQQALPTTTISTLQKSETPVAPELADQKHEQQVPALSATNETGHELSQPHSMPEKAEKSQPSTITESDQPSSNALSKMEDVENVQTAPSTLTQSSSNSFIPLTSESSTQPSEASVPTAPLYSSQAPVQFSQTSQPSSDLTKSKQEPVPAHQPAQPSVSSESPSSLDAKESHMALSKPSQGTSVDKAPPTDVGVGMAKAEPAAQSSQDSLKKETSDLIAGERGMEKDGCSSLAEEELSRLMHPSIVVGKKLATWCKHTPTL